MEFYIRSAGTYEADGIASAKTWMLDTVQRVRPTLRDLPSLACDDQIMNPSWRAPKFLLMEPVGHEPYDPECAWERLDEAGTAKVLDALADYALRRLRERIEEAAAAAYLEAAKRGKPAETGCF